MVARAPAQEVPVEGMGVAAFGHGERGGAQRLSRDLAAEEIGPGSKARGVGAKKVPVQCLEVEQGEETVSHGPDAIRRRGPRIGTLAVKLIHQDALAVMKRNAA